MKKVLNSSINVLNNLPKQVKFSTSIDSNSIECVSVYCNPHLLPPSSTALCLVGTGLEQHVIEMSVQRTINSALLFFFT